MGMREVRTAAGGNSGEERKSAWIPWVFVGFFVVVIGVNAVMVALALATWTGVETDHPYEDGLAYQATLDAERKQAELGWKVDLAFEAADRDHAAVTVTMLDREGAPIHGADVHARFIRPTREGFDSAVALRELGEGRYGAESRVEMPGQWNLVVVGSYDGHSYQVRRRVFVPK
jgi:nitrogen fixation protein FixH